MSCHKILNRDVIIEMRVVGQYVQVKAMDTASLTEITTQGPATASEDILQRNAMKRLEYVLKKKNII